MKRILANSLAIIAATMALSACHKAASNAPTAKANADKPIASVLGDATGMKTVAGALKTTGLEQVFTGAGSYTLLAPSDAAFAKLPQGGSALTADSGKAAMTALLRGQILPGFMTVDDIGKAIDNNGGSVTVRTMSGKDLKFTRSGGGAIVATGPEGETAQLGANGMRAGANMAIPVDGVLAKT